MLNTDDFEAALKAPTRLAIVNQFVAIQQVTYDAAERVGHFAHIALHSPLVLISLIAVDQLHVLHQAGLPNVFENLDNIPLDVTYCPYVVVWPDTILLVDDQHSILIEPLPRLSVHGYCAWASAPLFSANGHIIGALTVADTQTRTWTEHEIVLLRELAAGLMRELELHLQLTAHTRRVGHNVEQNMFITFDQHNAVPNALAQQSQQMFRTISDSSPNGIFVADVDGHLIYVNQQLPIILGCEPNDILGTHWSSVIDADDSQRVLDEWFARTSSQATMTSEYRLHRRDGQTRWIRGHHAALLDQRGALIGHVGTLEDMTRRRQLEEALRTSEMRFRIAVDRFPYSFLIYDADLRIQFVNQYGLQRSGHAMSDLLGRTDSELFPPNNTDSYLPLLHKARDTREPQSGQITIHFPDATAHILVTYLPVLNDDGTIKQIVAITYDITGQQETAMLLRQSEERYRLLFESNPQPMWVFDQQTLTFLAVNEAALQHYGYTSDEFLAMTIKDIRPQSDIPSLMRAFDDKQAPPNTPYQARHYKRDGTLIDVEIRGHRFNFDGRPAILVLINDITERLRAESVRQALERKLQETQKLESLGLLAGGIAHDFNNLLAAIMGNAGLALFDLPEDNPAHEAVQEIMATSRRAANLTQQMLAYAGRSYVSMQPLNLNNLVAEMMSLVAASISKTANVQYQLAQHLPLVEADQAQIKQVIMNIVTNASEAIGDANETIMLRTGVDHFDETLLAPSMGTTELHAGRYVYLQVTDTGDGMDRDTMTRIFEPFFTTKFIGRGLGLAAVQGIVRRHRGGLLVQSAPGQGATFTMLLPVAKINEVEQAPVLQQGSLLTTQRGVVLVIDDEETVRRLCERVLERAGYTVITAHDGQAGLTAFQQQADSIRCILLDLTMPRMNGEQVLRAIRDVRPDLQVVLMSGYNEHDVTERYHDLAATHFLQKPFTPQRMLELTRQAFDNHDG